MHCQGPRIPDMGQKGGGLVEGGGMGGDMGGDMANP